MYIISIKVTGMGARRRGKIQMGRIFRSSTRMMVLIEEFLRMLLQHETRRKEGNTGMINSLLHNIVLNIFC